MFIVIPTYHDKMAVHRIPVITLGIAVICIFIHFFTVFNAETSRQESIDAEEKLLEYLVSHNEIRFTREELDGFSPELQHLLYRVDTYKEGMGVGPMITAGTAPSDTSGMSEFVPDYEISDDLRALIADYEYALESDYFRRFGYVPAADNIIDMVSSIFVHGDIYHLLGNLLFLLLAGICIEDLWGRLLFVAFYLIGGIFAAWIHGLMQPDSIVPCIGASGAIAAAMGAFMVRLYNARIRFWYFILFVIFFKRGTFYLPAYVVLPFWLVNQLFWGMLSAGNEQAGGVAFWAHIGGFVFGAVIALLLKFSGLEKNIIAPSVERKSNLLNEHLSSGMTKLEKKDTRGAIHDLRQAVIQNPTDATTRGQLCRAYLQNGQIKLASLEFKRSIMRLMDQGLVDDAFHEYLLLSGKSNDLGVAPGWELKLISELEAAGKVKDALWALERLIDRCLKHPEYSKDPALINAVLRCGNLYLNKMEQPKEAFNVYRKFLKSGIQLSEIEKKSILIKAKKAKLVYQDGSRISMGIHGKGLALQPGTSTTLQIDKKCPKCGHAQPKGEVCDKCGVIFSKIKQNHSRPVMAPRSKASREKSFLRSAYEQMFIIFPILLLIGGSAYIYFQFIDVRIDAMRFTDALEQFDAEDLEITLDADAVPFGEMPFTTGKILVIVPAHVVRYPKMVEHIPTKIHSSWYKLDRKRRAASVDEVDTLIRIDRQLRGADRFKKAGGFESKIVNKNVLFLSVFNWREKTYIGTWVLAPYEQHPSESLTEDMLDEMIAATSDETIKNVIEAMPVR